MQSRLSAGVGGSGAGTGAFSNTEGYFHSETRSVPVSRLWRTSGAWRSFGADEPRISRLLVPVMKSIRKDIFMVEVQSRRETVLQAVVLRAYRSRLTELLEPDISFFETSLRIDWSQLQESKRGQKNTGSNTVFAFTELQEDTIAYKFLYFRKDG